MYHLLLSEILSSQKKFVHPTQHYKGSRTGIQLQLYQIQIFKMVFISDQLNTVSVKVGVGISTLNSIYL